ncbi:MAG: alpha/beta hydrolase [Thermoanaerobaculia bacterium]
MLRHPLLSRLGCGAAILASVALPAVMLTSLVRSMIFPAAQAPFPEPRAGEGWSVVRFETPDGLRLAGAFFPPPTPDAPVLLYFHGNAEAAAHNLPLAGELNARGLGVFLAEYRGYGGLRGSPSEEGLYADGEAAMAELGRLGVPPSRVVLVGRSLGSGVAVELATRNRVAAVVLVSAYTSLVDMGRIVAGPLAPLVVRDRFDSLGKLGRVAAPLVLLHGALDDVVPVAMGKRLAAARPDARWVEVAGTSHNEFPGLAALLAREVDAALARAPGGSTS